MIGPLNLGDGVRLAKVKYYCDVDVLTVYLKEVAEGRIEDHGRATILYREGKPIGFEIWRASGLHATAKTVVP